MAGWYETANERRIVVGSQLGGVYYVTREGEGDTNLNVPKSINLYHKLHL